jgi:hypothetical protein
MTTLHYRMWLPVRAYGGYVTDCQRRRCYDRLNCITIVLGKNIASLTD